MTTGLNDVLDAIENCLKNENATDDLTARVADLVFAYVGPPSSSGPNNGSEAKLKEIAVAVKEKFATDRFDFPYLRRLRSTAAKFPPEKRFAGVKFSLMVVACDFETLCDALARSYVEERQFSAEYIRKFRQARQTGHDDNDGDQAVRMHELVRRLVGEARFYHKFEPGDWSVEDREMLAAHARALIVSVHHFICAVEPTPMRQAAA
jgi:hypothetical protein